MMNFSSLLILVAAGCGIAEKGLVKEPVYVKALETNSAITCLTNIMNEEQDFTWTIVSANDELRMVEEDGYHYEILDFLKNIKKGEKAKTFTISTNAVYFFIEKIPVNYAGTADGMELGYLRNMPGNHFRQKMESKHMRGGNAGLQCRICIIGDRNLWSCTQMKWKFITNQTILSVTD